MFEQNPVLGPGTGTTTTHTLEILLMLAGAFLLGLWLGWLLWNRFKAAYDVLLAEHESTKLSLETASAELAAAQKRIAQFEADHATYRARIDSLTADYHDSEARFQHLNLHLSQLSERAASLELELASTRPAEIPMEVVESPIDVHVESLVESLPVVEAEALVVESPVIEITEEVKLPEVELPVIELPAIELPAVETLVVDPVAIETPVIETVVVETPVIEPPVIETVVVETPVVEHVSIAPVAISEPIAKKTYTGGSVVIERVTVHQPYVASEIAPVVSTPVVVETPEVVVVAEPVVGTPVAAPVFSFTPAASADDLRIVEGIGPKIEQVLNENGISTFRQLAETSEERLREILAGAGNRYKMHDPGSWAEQARLADAGDWEALKSWQEILKGGRETGSYDAPAELIGNAQLIEDQSVEAATVAETISNGVYAEPDILPVTDMPVAIDDLKVVEGIGPKIEELLVARGISNYATLASTPVAELKGILESAGSRFAIHDPGTWPAQALLASNGEWDNLKAYQGFLNAGKRPE